ncbi:MAG: hypothetical protein ACXWEY_02795 [Bacteroidia bacterium]
MKTFKAITALVLFITTVFFSACTKDDTVTVDNNSIDTKKKCYPTAITRNNQPALEFTYLADGKIDVMTIHDTNEVVTGPLKMNYSSNGTIARAQFIDKPIYYEFKYNDDKLVTTQTLYSDESGEKNLVVEYRFEYNAQKQLVKKLVISPWFGPEPYTYYTFNYDARGNASAIEIYFNDEDGQFNKIFKMQTLYDEKTNPFFGLNIPPVTDDMLLLGPNNAVKSTFYDENNTPVETRTAALIFNTNGYPEEINYTGEKPLSEKYTYECK